VINFRSTLRILARCMASEEWHPPSASPYRERTIYSD